VSSFTIIKGSLIDETYAAFQRWDLDGPKATNLERIRANGALASVSSNWARDVSKVLNRRFDPSGRERAVVGSRAGVVAGRPRAAVESLHLWRDGHRW